MHHAAGGRVNDGQLGSDPSWLEIALSGELTLANSTGVDDFVAAGAHSFHRIRSNPVGKGQRLCYESVVGHGISIDFNKPRNQVRDQVRYPVVLLEVL